MVEFTGERVIPDQVSADLWSEHLARYAFARRFAAGKRVLDAGCGTGYGSAELAQVAAFVSGLDASPDAAHFAHSNYPLPAVRFTAGRCESLPFRNGSFDLIVAFEVIEHLENYRGFIMEAARVLTPHGCLLVSTPNKLYYEASRAASGPNPFHEHEFGAQEFVGELQQAFPNVALALQNRVESFVFHPAKNFWPAEARIDGGGGSADDAHFLLAVCAKAALPDLRSFCYVPRAANILREREQHIAKLETELNHNQEWLAQIRIERDELLDMYRKQKSELEERNRWAVQLSQELALSQERVVAVQNELAEEQSASAEMALGYEWKVRELEGENAAKTRWAQETDARLTEEVGKKSAELAECVRLLDQAESTVQERTLWAQSLAAQLKAARSSKWLRLGRRLGLGPAISEQ